MASSTSTPIVKCGAPAWAMHEYIHPPSAATDSPTVVSCDGLPQWVKDACGPYDEYEDDYESESEDDRSCAGDGSESEGGVEDDRASACADDEGNGAGSDGEADGAGSDGEADGARSDGDSEAAGADGDSEAAGADDGADADGCVILTTGDAEQQRRRSFGWPRFIFGGGA